MDLSYIDLPAGRTAIRTENAAFDPCPACELARIADKYAGSERGTPILDYNGNRVGRVGYQRGGCRRDF